MLPVLLQKLQFGHISQAAIVDKSTCYEFTTLSSYKGSLNIQMCSFIQFFRFETSEIIEWMMAISLCERGRGQVGTKW